jgi:hypothetical protein
MLTDGSSRRDDEDEEHETEDLVYFAIVVSFVPS